MFPQSPDNRMNKKLKVLTKELSLCHKLWFSNHYIFGTKCYFKLWILLDQVIRVWNIKGLQHRVLKILWFKYLILFQRLNSFNTIKIKKNSNPERMRLTALEINRFEVDFCLNLNAKILKDLVIIGTRQKIRLFYNFMLIFNKRFSFLSNIENK